MYRVTYTQGNGYRCGCCRSTWEGSQDFKTEKEVIDFLVRKEYVRRNPKESEWEDEDDWTLEEVREVKDDDLTDKFSDMVDILVDNKDKVKARKMKLIQLAAKYKKELGEYEED